VEDPLPTIIRLDFVYIANSLSTKMAKRVVSDAWGSLTNGRATEEKASRTKA
jgi:hypothetical protein